MAELVNARGAIFLVVLVALVQLHECGRAPCVSGHATPVHFETNGGVDIPHPESTVLCSEKDAIAEAMGS
jgi:hypothetical protein